MKTIHLLYFRFIEEGGRSREEGDMLSILQSFNSSILPKIVWVGAVVAVAPDVILPKEVVLLGVYGFGAFAPASGLWITL